MLTSTAQEREADQGSGDRVFVGAPMYRGRNQDRVEEVLFVAARARHEGRERAAPQRHGATSQEGRETKTKEDGDKATRGITACGGRDGLTGDDDDAVATARSATRDLDREVGANESRSF